MDSATIRVQRLRDGAKLPFRASEHATGYDLYACLGEGNSVEIGQSPALVPTGIAIETPPGYDVQVRPRSGLAKRGVLCTFGTIDADYRGELMVTLYAFTPGVAQTIHDGDRIAQLVVSRIAPVTFEEATALSETTRGDGGHGSTGR